MMDAAGDISRWRCVHSMQVSSWQRDHLRWMGGGTALLPPTSFMWVRKNWHREDLRHAGALGGTFLWGTYRMFIDPLETNEVDDVIRQPWRRCVCSKAARAVPNPAIILVRQHPHQPALNTGCSRWPQPLATTKSCPANDP